MTELKAITGKAAVIWKGPYKRGNGAMSTWSALLARAKYGPGRGSRGKATHPSELIAAAHAASFSITLAHELDLAGHTPRQIDAAATVTTEYIAARWTMSRIHLEVTAGVRKMEQSDFVDVTLRAKANCPVSRLVNANISMEARLDNGKS